MFRKHLIDLLQSQPLSIAQIARTVGEPPRQIADDLAHLLRSLKHTAFKAVVEPATCRACGFQFSHEKLNKPSKCPKCHSRWLTEPHLCIAPKK